MKSLRVVILLILPLAFTSLSLGVQAQTVYITKSGTKYHKDGCVHLKSRIAINKQDALNRGYQACGTCKPGGGTVAAYKHGQDTVNKSSETNQTKQSSSGRCQAITKAGTQCKRSGPHGGYCYQHVR